MNTNHVVLKRDMPRACGKTAFAFEMAKKLKIPVIVQTDLQKASFKALHPLVDIYCVNDLAGRLPPDFAVYDDTKQAYGNGIWIGTFGEH